MSVWAWIITISLGMSCAGTALAWVILRRGGVYDKDMGLDAEERQE